MIRRSPHGGSHNVPKRGMYLAVSLRLSFPEAADKTPGIDLFAAAHTCVRSRQLVDLQPATSGAVPVPHFEHAEAFLNVVE